MKNEQNESRTPRDFWDISDLVPRRKSSYVRPAAPDVSAVEITLPPTAAQVPKDDKGAPMPSDEVRKNATAAAKDAAPSVTLMSGMGTVMAGDVPLPRQFVSRSHEDEEGEKPLPEATFHPDSALIHEVRIYPHKSEYSYYEQFCRHAARLMAVEGKPTEAVPFFSYMPQYSQLNRAQLGYYLWWRSNFRRGMVLEADYSYLLLYLYELINLGGREDPRVGQESMLRLWLSYREKYPRLDVLVREWLCDYSLLHRLSPPALPRDSFRELIAGCRLKEFYVSAAKGDAMCDAVLHFCSNYDYKKSKFYKGDAVPLFDRILRGAVRVTLDHVEAQGSEKGGRAGGFSTITRDAFSGAICAWAQKKRIEVDFASFSHTYELRYVITDVLKYAENALRAVLGVKSRLTVYEVSNELKARLDAYLAEALPKKQTQKRPQRPQQPAYEARYDLAPEPISPQNAAKIEAVSWQTTKRLVEAFEAPPTVKAPPSAVEEQGQAVRISAPIPPSLVAQSAFAAPVPPPATPSVSAAPAALSVIAHAMPPAVPSPAPGAAAAHDRTFAAAIGALAAFVPLAAARDRAGQRALADRLGLMPDAIADKINTVSGDMLGDIVLEDLGGVYGIVEDYREFLEEEGVLP